MPTIGLGTWRTRPEEIDTAISTALKSGYRHIDSAFVNNNEEAIGAAIQKWIKAGNKREDLFITNKLPSMAVRAVDVPIFLKQSLTNMKLDYFDLYLIHTPFGFLRDEKKMKPKLDRNGIRIIDRTTDHLSTWKAMEDQVNSGLVKNIGLANFNTEQLEKIYNRANIKPSVLQMEMHLHCQQKKLRNVCQNLKVAVSAFSPLGSPGVSQHIKQKYHYQVYTHPDALGHPEVAVLSSKYKKRPGQILLRHLIQEGVAAIPKSANPKRILENFKIFNFEIDKNDIETLRAIDRGSQGRIFDFLYYKGVERHPEYPFKKHKH